MVNVMPGSENVAPLGPKSQGSKIALLLGAGGRAAWFATVAVIANTF